MPFSGEGEQGEDGDRYGEVEYGEAQDVTNFIGGGSFQLDTAGFIPQRENSYASIDPTEPTAPAPPPRAAHVPRVALPPTRRPRDLRPPTASTTPHVPDIPAHVRTLEHTVSPLFNPQFRSPFSKMAENSEFDAFCPPTPKQ